MPSIFLQIFFSFFLFNPLFTSSFVYARSGNFNSSVVDDTPRLAEKKFKFPFLPANSGPNIEDLGHYAGYYELPNTSARMFYFFFESRNGNKNDPIVLWLSGGPGASGNIALFYENGPFNITDELSLMWTDYGWDKISNIIYVDQPIGTGFSYTTDDYDIRDNTIDISNDLYDFLQVFFQKHRQFIQTDFFITGQSYAGHYAPALASRILRGNKETEKIYIELKGFAIGNGLTNPGIQYLTIPAYAWHHKVITELNYTYIKEYIVPECESSIKDCDNTGDKDDCIIAYEDCVRQILPVLRDFAGNRNLYDIRKQRIGTLGYSFSNVEKFLNMPVVRNALGVEKPFVSMTERIFKVMIGDFMKNFDVEIPDLLKNDIKVLIYVGDQDLICNWVGNLNWVLGMEWDGKKKFKEAPFLPFIVDGVKQGWMSNYGPLTFIKINQAGHMVPMDQPKVAFHMIQSWMKGEL